MGTSGSYGGSGRAAWQAARQMLIDLPDSAGGSSNDSGAAADSPALDDLLSSIGDALIGEDPSLGNDQPNADFISIASLLPHLRGSSTGSGGSGAGAATGGARPAGRTGAGSKRQVVRGAARGGAAVGAGFAVRQGDAEALAELGLDLEQLRGLGPVRQCATILDAVLGEGGHPDEYALRKASLESLKEVLMSDTPPDEHDVLRGFVVNYIFELSLVELQAQLDAGAVDAPQAAKRERQIRRYLERRVATIRLPDGHIGSRDLRTMSAKLTAEAVRVIRAGAEAS